MIANSIEIDGTLQPDGRLILDEKPILSPGRVRVALRSLPESPAKTDRLPDTPWLDESIPAPLDLPRSGTTVPVHPRLSGERLPELPANLAEEAE